MTRYLQNYMFLYPQNRILISIKVKQITDTYEHDVNNINEPQKHMLSERVQKQKTTFSIFPFVYEMSKKGKCIRKEGKLPGAEDGAGD